MVRVRPSGTLQIVCKVVRSWSVEPLRIDVTDPRSPSARHCLQAYFEELSGRFDDGFDPELSNSASDAEMSMPNGLLMVASVNGAPVGCGALKFHADGEIAEVKRMWVSPQARGLGVGRTLLERLVDEAVSKGIRTLRLETNRVLIEARLLYESAGFVEVDAFNDEPYADHWFQKNVERQP